MADFMSDSSSQQRPQQQGPQNFSQMQQQGQARPPHPAYGTPQGGMYQPQQQQQPYGSYGGSQQPQRVGMQGGGQPEQPQNPNQPFQPPSYQPPPQPQYQPPPQPPPGPPPQGEQPPQSGNGPGTGIIPQFQQPQGNGQFNQGLQNYAQNWMNNPNPYNQQVAQDIYSSLSNQVGQTFDVQRQLAQEQSARQGLSSSTIAQGRQGDLAIRQGQTMSGLAAQIAQQAAMTNSGAQQAAGNFGLGVGNQNFNQGLQSYYGNLAGQGQNFNQNLQQGYFNQNQDYMNNQLLLQLLGVT